MIEFFYDITQGSDEWHELRLGVVTASNINILITPSGKPAKNEKMRMYAAEIAAQRINRIVEDNYQSFDMVRGHIQEDIARDIYNDNYAPVTQCGFIQKITSDGIIGCSPDGLVGLDGGIEIKSRLAKFQVSTIIADEVPDDYLNQIQAFLLVSERDWCDFVQYSNGMPLFVKRVYPDYDRHAAITEAIREFEIEVNRVMTDYLGKSAWMVPTERVDFLSDDLIEGSE